VPNEHAENAGTRKRRHPEEPPALDPLENDIRNWTLCGTKNWTPFGIDVAALPAGGLVQVVHRKDPRAAG
jgi:hypothetical protein